MILVHGKNESQIEVKILLPRILSGVNSKNESYIDRKECPMRGRIFLPRAPKYYWIIHFWALSCLHFDADKNGCLSHCPIAVKRHHEQGNSYKGNIIGAGLQFQGFSPLSSRQEAWQHPVRCGAGVLHLDLKASGRDSEPLGLAWAYETSEPTPQWHAASNEAISPNSATPCGPMGAILFNPYRNNYDFLSVRSGTCQMAPQGVVTGLVVEVSTLGVC